MLRQERSGAARVALLGSAGEVAAAALVGNDGDELHHLVQVSHVGSNELLSTLWAHGRQPQSTDALSRPGVALGVLDQPTQGVDELHLLDRVTARLQQAGRADKNREALRAGDRDVEAVARKEEREIPRHVLAARGRHREEHDRRLLPLE
jgi:hypothetical protein